MAGKIIWTEKAKHNLIEILTYWNNRNKSKTFSSKLNTLIQNHLQLVLDFPNIGRETDISNVQVKVIRSYLLYYEFINEDLHVLTIRHGSRDPKTLEIK